MSRGFHRALGHAGNARGRANEERLLASLLRLGPSLPWFVSARAGTPEEDRDGADAVVETNDVGKLFLQAKSSKAQARLFRASRRRLVIGVVVVSDHDERLTDERVRSALGELRAEIANLRRTREP